MPNIDQNLPTSEGIYLARESEHHGWYNLIAYVYGKHPFFRVDVLVYTEHRLIRSIDFIDFYFGPRVDIPTVPKDQVTQRW